MRGYENSNFDMFDRVAAYIKSTGHVPISPAEMDRFYEGWDKYPPYDVSTTKADMKRFITRDLEAILTCQGIYMLPGWEVSKGAIVERALAEFLELNIYFHEKQEALANV
jgi:hypothetical protein